MSVTRIRSGVIKGYLAVRAIDSHGLICCCHESETLSQPADSGDAFVTITGSMLTKYNRVLEGCLKTNFLRCFSLDLRKFSLRRVREAEERRRERGQKERARKERKG